MPTGSVRLQSIKKLGQENHSYEPSDEGNAAFPWQNSSNDNRIEVRYFYLRKNTEFNLLYKDCSLGHKLKCA